MSYQRPQFAVLSSRLDEPRRFIQVVAGSRQVGKTTLVQTGLELVRNKENYLLQDPSLRLEFESNPSRLINLVRALDKNPYVFIDECQKVPALLDAVQLLLDNKEAKFILTGSSARKLRHQFEALKPTRVWFKAQQDGTDIDMDAYLNFHVNQHTEHHDPESRLYKAMKNSHRDMASLLLADLSLSTDSWINNTARTIDVIRDSLYLFAESLTATNDRFAIHGFSSRNRNHVRFNIIKNFEDTYNANIRGRIQAIKPGFYTRMGAAIRYASTLLEKQPAQQKLLLLLTDGKPNDLDMYEGRYGVEDTRKAISEARQLGLQVFCVTIDEKANDYLPHIFGSGSYVVIRKANELPRELPLLYARLTGN